MSALFLVLCASAVFVQAISCACVGNGLGNAGISNIGYSGCGNGLSNAGISNIGYGNGFGNGYGNGNGNVGINAGYGLGAATSGGALTVSSASPIAPSGLTVISENELGGPLSVSGVMPFLTAVALEGEVASGGSAGVQYSCGNGNIGIVSENVAAAGNGYGYGAGLGYGSGFGNSAGLGYGAGFGNSAGLGYGAGFGNNIGLGCGAGLGAGYGLGAASSGSCGCSDRY